MPRDSGGRRGWTGGLVRVYVEEALLFVSCWLVSETMYFLGECMLSIKVIIGLEMWKKRVQHRHERKSNI